MKDDEIMSCTTIGDLLQYSIEHNVEVKFVRYSYDNILIFCKHYDPVGQVIQEGKILIQFAVLDGSRAGRDFVILTALQKVLKELNKILWN